MLRRDSVFNDYERVEQAFSSELARSLLVCVSTLVLLFFHEPMS